MIIYEDRCNGCPDCRMCGRSVPQKVHICDHCKQEDEDLYIFDGEELCADCILDSLEKVDQE